MWLHWSFYHRSCLKVHNVRPFLLRGGCGFREFGSWSSWLAEPQIEISYFWIHVFVQDSLLKIPQYVCLERCLEHVKGPLKTAPPPPKKKKKCEAKTFLSDILPIPCQCSPAAACDFEMLNAAWLPEALEIQPQLSRKTPMFRHQNMEPKQSHHSHHSEKESIKRDKTPALHTFYTETWNHFSQAILEYSVSKVPDLLFYMTWRF